MVEVKRWTDGLLVGLQKTEAVLLRVLGDSRAVAVEARVVEVFVFVVAFLWPIFVFVDIWAVGHLLLGVHLRQLLREGASELYVAVLVHIAVWLRLLLGVRLVLLLRLVHHLVILVGRALKQLFEYLVPSLRVVGGRCFGGHNLLTIDSAGDLGMRFRVQLAAQFAVFVKCMPTVHEVLGRGRSRRLPTLQVGVVLLLQEVIQCHQG